MPFADLIVTNAKAMTMDPALPRAQAVAIAKGRILAVGSMDAVSVCVGPAPCEPCTDHPAR